MKFSQGVVPFVTSELEFKKLSSQKFITYNRLLDKQLCQFIALGRDNQELTDKEVKTLSDMITVNIYSLTGYRVKVKNVSILVDNKSCSTYENTGYVVLRTKTKSETSTTHIISNEKAEKCVKLQYSIGDFILCKKGIKLELDTVQNILKFELVFSSESEWVDAEGFTVKPTR